MKVKLLKPLEVDFITEKVIFEVGTEFVVEDVIPEMNRFYLTNKEHDAAFGIVFPYENVQFLQ